MVTIVISNDWEGLYINGELIQESHQIRARDVLDALKIKHDRIICDEQWLEDRGCLPAQLNEVKAA